MPDQQFCYTQRLHARTSDAVHVFTTGGFAIGMCFALLCIIHVLCMYMCMHVMSGVLQGSLAIRKEVISNDCVHL